MEKLEQTPMSDKVKERIEKEEEEHLHGLSIQYRESQYEQIAIGKDKVAAITASLHAQVGFEHGYRAAKTAERPKAWNEAVDEAIKIVTCKDFNLISQQVKALEKLKHKQP